MDWKLRVHDARLEQIMRTHAENSFEHMMARELLELRDGDYAKEKREHDETLRRYKLKAERLAAAEKVVDAAQDWYDNHGGWNKEPEERALSNALEAYDKVKNNDK